MAATAEPTHPADATHGADHGHAEHGHHDHGPYFAHHFESWKQQFDAGKLGMWAFLVQEVLFFSGLFCAYAVYRTIHPEVFEYADQFLSVPHGAFNTVVLLFSSLTMAWGVRCSMLGQRTGLLACLAITLACAALFLGVKAYEYTEKYHAQLIWAGADPLTSNEGMQKLILLNPELKMAGERLEEALTSTLHTIEFYTGLFALACVVISGLLWTLRKGKPGAAIVAGCLALCGVSMIAGIEISLGIHHAFHEGEHAGTDGHGAEHEIGHESETATLTEEEQLLIPEAETFENAKEAPGAGAMSPALPLAERGAVKGEVVGEETADAGRPNRLGVFFSIYYAMTGVHALHILGGMAVITWLIVRAFKNHFTPEYFGPVDFVGLYWHLVDLVWIYLFPLLYLIG